MPAESKAQQHFMGMVHATQKGEMDAPSKAVSKAAGSMTEQASKDFASTKTKGLPKHKKTEKKSNLCQFVEKLAAGPAAAAAPVAAPAATPAPLAPGAAPAQGFDINKTLQGAGNWLGQQTTNLGQSLNLNPQQIAMIKQYAPYLLGGAALGGIGGYMTDGFGGALKGMLLGGGAGAAGKYGLDQYNEYQAKPEIGEDEVQEWRKQQGLVNPA